MEQAIPQSSVAAAFVDVAIAEADGYVVDELGDLEAFEVSVASVLGDQGFMLPHAPPPYPCR